MPNQPKTPMRSFRISDELYGELSKLAQRRNVSVSDVVREALEKFVSNSVWDES
jgi:predicted transcriptional regulator